MKPLFAAALLTASIALSGAPAIAQAKAPPTCGSNEPREVSLYFERDQTQLNDFSKALVERVANEAKHCGLSQVVAETKIDAKRANIITDTFQARGVKVILVSPAMSQASGDDVAARSAKLRLTLNDNKVG